MTEHIHPPQAPGDDQLPVIEYVAVAALRPLDFESTPTLAPDREYERMMAGFVPQRKALSTATLRDSLSDFLNKFGAALGTVPKALADYEIDEIELSLDVSSEGQVSLILGEAKVGASVGMKVTLKRKIAAAKPDPETAATAA